MRALFLLVVVACANASLAAAPPVPVEKRPTVAVLYFDVPEAGPKADELLVFRKGLAEMMITDLSSTGELRVVERERLEAVLTEQALQQSQKLDPATAVKVGKLLGARYLVWGSVFLAPIKNSPLVFQAKTVIVETGEVKQSRVVGTVDDMLDFEGQLSTSVLTAIGAFEKRPAPELPKKSTKLPFETAVKFARALDASDRHDVPAAKVLLTEVVKAQPDFKLAQLDLLALTK
jgi:TolB-like protein